MELLWKKYIKPQRKTLKKTQIKRFAMLMFAKTQ